jgi:hypothetical protein
MEPELYCNGPKVTHGHCLDHTFTLKSTLKTFFSSSISVFRADGNESPLFSPKSSLEINPKDYFPLERKGPYLEKPLQYSSGSCCASDLYGMVEETISLIDLYSTK